jgi:hypothetical protein
MRSFALLATLGLLAVFPLGAATGSDPCDFGTKTVHVTFATNTAALNPKTTGLNTDQTNGLTFAYFALPANIDATHHCTFTATVTASALPDAAMSLHYFDINWAHLEPDTPNADQCDGKAPGTVTWSCPVTTSGIHYVVVDGNEGVSVDVTVSAVDL